MSNYFRKKLIKKVKTTSIETETTKITYTLLDKVWHHSIIRLGNKHIKKSKKTATLKNWLIFLKTINFKIMKILDSN